MRRVNLVLLPKIPNNEFYANLIKKAISLHGTNPQAIKRDFLPAYSLQVIREYVSRFLVDRKPSKKQMWEKSQDLVFIEFLKKLEKVKPKERQTMLTEFGINEVRRMILNI